MDMPLLCYFGHHKCASTWVHSILDTVCADAGLRLSYLHHPRNFGGDLPRHVREQRIDFVSYVNADARHLEGLPPLRGFHVVRDPRDILVSGYFSHRNSHPTADFPELPPHREALRRASKEEGLHLEMEFSFTRQVFAEMERWQPREDVLELRQEELTPDAYNGFLRIFRFLGILDEEHLSKRAWLPLMARAVINILHRQHPRLVPVRSPLIPFPAERLLGIVHDHRFERIAGRERGTADERSHYRKGVAGDWKEHFGREHVEHFRELYGRLLGKLGYAAEGVTPGA